MQRKYIYIIVFLLTIIISVSDYYVELSLTVPNVNELEATNSLEPNLFDDTEYVDIFDSAAMKSPVIIRNYQNDEEEITYTYNLKIDGVYGAHRYESTQKDGYIVFSANGETSFELKSNEIITIYDIPNDVEYYIEQVTRDSEKYITKINDIEGFSITGTVFIETHIDIENNTRPTYTPPVVETPEQDNETNNEIKQEESNKQESSNIEHDNPVTSDNLYGVIIALIIMIGLLIGLFKIKVKRFE